MKAQTKAILASLVVIAVALSAVSGVTYSWWSDSENTDITVGTGMLDVAVDDPIKYYASEGSSGFFGVGEQPAYSQNDVAASLSYIGSLDNVAPNDVYYIEYDVTFTTSVYAKYIVDVSSSADWVDAKVKIESMEYTGVADVIISDEFELYDWVDLPSGELKYGETHVAHASILITLTIADDAPMNTDDEYDPATVEIVNEITQKGNEVGGAIVTVEDNVVTGTTTDVAVPIKATFTFDEDVDKNTTYTFKYSASEVADDFKDGMSFEFTLEDSAGAKAEFKSVDIEVTMPGVITEPVVFCGGERITDVSVNDNIVTFTTTHFSNYTVLDTVMDVENDAELSDALDVIKAYDALWDKSVTINLAAGTYSENHNIYQYPTWNGVMAHNSSNNLSGKVASSPVTHLKFVGGDDVRFTGIVTVSGWGDSQNDFTNAKASTVFQNVAFDAGCTVPTSVADINVVLTAAANDVTFTDCKFSNATHITVGQREGGCGYANDISFIKCEFENGNCISGYATGTLTIDGCSVKGAYNGFVNIANKCDVVVSNTTVECTGYAFRTGNSNIDISVNGGSISVEASNGQYDSSNVAGSKYLGWFRGSGHTATFTGYDLDGYLFTGENVVKINDFPYVFNSDQLQDALDVAENGGVIILGADITGDVTVTQKPDVEITLDGNGKTYAGSITVDGKSSRYETTGLLIKDVKFEADDVSANVCIRLGDGTNATRYTNNVTVESCTFNVPGAVGVKSYTGGDLNLIIKDCTAESVAHSLVQVINVETNLVISDCRVYSKNGINVNSSPDVTINGCEIYVKGYAVRFGVDGTGSVNGTYLIENCELKSENDDNDSVIIFRDSAKSSKLTIKNTSIVGINENVDLIKNNVGAKVLIDGVPLISTQNGLNDIKSGDGKIALSNGEYALPSVSNKTVNISGTKNTIITVDKPNYSGSDLVLNGVTVKGSGFATGVLHVDTVTYDDVRIVGEMCLYGEKVVFNYCTFELAAGQYIWTYGAKEVEFNHCTFNTAGKAILIYNEGAGASNVTVKGCTFDATEGAKAGEIANQNCAAIEINNFQTTSIGTAHVLITEDNTYSDYFSGEWRIKKFVSGNPVTVNDVEYTQIALDGKLMTINDDKNVTVLN